MSQSLCFNDFIFSPITRDNQPWFKSSEIARALGYKREDKVTQIYQRNADEFTEGMTQLVEISAEPQNEVLGNFGTGRARIFSLRGCHLLAMFARTPVAKAFRKWVLDVIEQYGDRVPVAEPVTLNDELISASERAELKLIVDAQRRCRARPAPRYGQSTTATSASRNTVSSRPGLCPRPASSCFPSVSAPSMPYPRRNPRFRTRRFPSHRHYTGTA